MSKPIKLCRCGKSPKILSNVDSSFKAYTIVCTACGRKKAGTTMDRVTKKWNRRNVYSRNGGKYYVASK